MRKNACLILLACVVLAGAAVGCGPQGEASDREPVVGGYTEDRDPSEDELEIFAAVTAEGDGVGYQPTLVATQVVAGTNYRFTATATLVAAGEEPYEVYVYIYQPLRGSPELTEIVRIDAE